MGKENEGHVNRVRLKEQECAVRHLRGGLDRCTSYEVDPRRRRAKPWHTRVQGRCDDYAHQEQPKDDDRQAIARYGDSCHEPEELCHQTEGYRDQPRRWVNPARVDV